MSAHFLLLFLHKVHENVSHLCSCKPGLANLGKNSNTLEAISYEHKKCVIFLYDGNIIQVATKVHQPVLQVLQ